MIILQEKVALVTGGTRGIGAAIAELLAESGAHVVVTYRSNRTEANRFIAKMRRWGLSCEAIRLDVADEKKVARIIKNIRERCGEIDILVNNAGIWVPAPIGATSSGVWRRTIDVNLIGTFNCCNAVIPSMKHHGGKIVNIASTAGQRGEAGYSHYAASKGGIIAFTKSIAAELAPYRINVNCVAPGWVTTDMTIGTIKQKSARREIIKSIPRGRIANPEDIAGPVLFLCSDLSNHMVGAVLSVNGGSVMA